MTKIQPYAGVPNHAIREIGGPQAVALLIPGLRSEDVSISWTASDGLIALGDRVMRPLLHALAYDRPTLLFHRAARRVLRRVAPRHDARFERLLRSLAHETTVVQSPPLAAELLRMEQAPERVP